MELLLERRSSLELELDRDRVRRAETNFFAHRRPGAGELVIPRLVPFL